MFLGRHSLQSLLLLFAITGGSQICASPTLAQSPQVEAFVTSATALVKSSEDGLQNGRSIERLSKLRGATTRALLTGATKDKLTIQVDINNSDLLCNPRLAVLHAALAKGYIQSLSAKVADLTNPKKLDTLSAAIGSLFSSYNLDLSDGIATEADLAKAGSTILRRCQNDLINYERVFYGTDIQPSTEKGPSLAVFTAITAVVDVFKQLIQPFIIDGAQMINDARREAAIRSFLANPKNSQSIRAAGEVLSSYVSKYVWDKRLRLAGQFAVGAAAFRSIRVDLSKSTNCKTYYASFHPDPVRKMPGAGDSSLSSEQIENAKLNATSLFVDPFVTCWQDAWQQLSSTTKPLLTAAAEYDQLADAGDSDNAKKAFAAMSANLEKIGTGRIETSNVWTWAARIIAFGEKVQAAASEENKKKLTKAIDDLVDALSPH